MSKALFAFFSIAAITAAIIFSACFGISADQFVTSENAADRKVVMIVADYLDIEDIKGMDYLSSKTSESHIALINNRQLGKAGASKAKLIIGSGRRLELNSGAVIGGSAESFRELFSIESGRTPKEDSLVYTDIYKLKNNNSKSEYQKYIGYLGDMVKSNNGNTCFLGNSDTSMQNRSSMLIAMNSSGEVDLGETEAIIIEDEGFPYGRRTNYRKLAELYKQYLTASSFIVIETGDLERLEVFKESMSKDSYETYRHAILKDIDILVKELSSNGGYNTLIFISTYPSKSNAEAGDRLTPIVVLDVSGEGTLYSRNTRREGIILNTDLVDYILYKLGYKASSSIDELKREHALQYLETMNSNVVKTSKLRAPILTAYAVIIIAAIMMLFFIVVFTRGENNNAYFLLSRITAYSMLVFPIILLYLPSTYVKWDTFIYVSFVVALAVMLSLILDITLRGKVRVIFAICILLFLSLSIDIFLDSHFMKQSVLGYDPIIGARFYGIGNEYSGMFIGCSLMIFGCISELMGNKPGKSVAVSFFLFCTQMLGLTLFGANFGGAIAGASGYILAYSLVYGIKFNKRNISIGILILAAAVGLLIISDSLGISSTSHIGSLVKEIKANGLGVLTETINRKLSMNLRLMRYTIWTKVLICIIAAIAIMFFRPVKLLGKVFKSYKYLKYAWISIAASAVVGFAVNDSGIVLAATAMIYAAFTMLIMCIGERNDSKDGL